MKSRNAGNLSGPAFIIVSVFVLILIATILAPAHKNKYTEALELAGEWYLANSDGFFVYYQYDPIKKKHSTEQHPLRELAGLWSVAALANHLDDPRLEQLAISGFTSFEDTFQWDESGGFYTVGAIEGREKLGHSAFVVLTLLELDDDLQDEYLQLFLKGILEMQEPSGRFRTWFYANATSGQDYYPGEALFALMEAYEHTGDPRYLGAVERAFPYYRDYWDSNKNTAFVPWQSRAYAAYTLETGDEDAEEFVFEMNDWMVRQHLPLEGCVDFSFFGIREGVYLEGVVEAYELAVSAGDEERMLCYGNLVREGVDYVLGSQITGEGNESAALGGFAGNDGILRIDRTQHAVFALMGACEAGIVECGP